MTLTTIANKCLKFDANIAKTDSWLRASSAIGTTHITF